MNTALTRDDVQELYRKHRIKMIFKSNFQNPTGTMLHQTVEKLLSLCADLRIAIVEDDPSSLLTLERNNLALL